MNKTLKLKKKTLQEPNKVHIYTINKQNKQKGGGG